ncbi:MAG: hypothetical protein AB1921_15535 [Thermodesulfobacteriota bacterium]
MQCRNHPDREARVRCEKMQVGYCEDCLDNCEACTDPCGYCKFRSSCIIYDQCKKSDKAKRLKEESQGVKQ